MKMRTFAQKPKQPQTPSSLDFVRSGLVNHSAASQTGSILQLQRAIESQPGKLARKAESEGGAVAPGTSTFAHDLSRIPVYAQRPATVPNEGTDPGAESLGQGDCPPGKTWIAGKHVAPQFVLDKPTPEVSIGFPEHISSLTLPDKNPKVTGSAAVDCKDRVWRYQLDPFVSNVQIRIFYYPKKQYPAPKPTDDEGPLTNVTRQNCGKMVEGLYKYRADVPRCWAAYMQDHLHEDYHYNIEWKGAMNKFVPKFESEVGKIKVPFTKAKTAAEAEKLLEPEVQSKFWDIGYGKEWHAWDDIPDVPGKGAYLAQVPAVENLIKKIVNWSVSKKWLPAGYTPGKGPVPADSQNCEEKHKSEKQPGK
jgi:hypothetical protein